MSHKYPHPDTGKKVIPSVTTIISACTDKSGALTQWAANQVVEWIRLNCDNTGRGYTVWDEDLESARFHFRDVSQEALDVGSEVHAAIEKYLLCSMNRKYEDLLESAEYRHIVYQLSSQATNAFNAFLQWADEHDLKPIALEQRVFGKCGDFWWGGMLDFVGWFNGKKYVIDWKSSKAMYPEYRYQVAAYRKGVIDRDCGSVIGGQFTYPSEYVSGCGVLRLDKTTGLPEWKDTSKTYERDLKIFNKMAELYFLKHPIIAKKSRAA